MVNVLDKLNARLTTLSQNPGLTALNTQLQALQANQAVLQATQQSIAGIAGMAGQLRQIGTAMQQVGQGAKNVASALQVQHRAQQQAHTSASGLAQGLFGAEISTARLVRAMATLYTTFSFLRKGASEAAAFQNSMESSRLSIAAFLMTFRTFTSGGQEVNQYTAALHEASLAQEQLRVAAFKTTATFMELVSGYQKVVSASAGTKATRDEMVRLTVVMSNMAASTGQSFETLTNQFRTVLLGISRTTGTIGGTMRAMGITPDVLKSWREQGIILQELLPRLEAFEKIGLDINKTWKGALSNLQDSLENFLGVGFSGAINAAKAFVGEITAQFANVDESLRTQKFVFNEDNMRRAQEISTSAASAMASLRPLIAEMLQLVGSLVKAALDGLAAMKPLIDFIAAVALPAFRALVESGLGKYLFALLEVSLAMQAFTRIAEFLIAPLITLKALFPSLTLATSAWTASMTAGTFAVGQGVSTVAALTLGLGALGVAIGVSIAAIARLAQAWEDWQAKKANQRADAGEFMTRAKMGERAGGIYLSAGDESRLRQAFPSLADRNAALDYTRSLVEMNRSGQDTVGIGNELEITFRRFGKELESTANHANDMAKALSKAADVMNKAIVDGVRKAGGAFGDAKAAAIGQLQDMLGAIKENTGLSDVADKIKADIKKLTGGRGLLEIPALDMESQEGLAQAKQFILGAVAEIFNTYKQAVAQEKKKLDASAADLGLDLEGLVPGIRALKSKKTEQDLVDSLESIYRRIQDYGDKIKAKLGDEPSMRGKMNALLQQVELMRQAAVETGAARSDSIASEKQAALANEVTEAYEKMIKTYARMSVVAADTAEARVEAEYQVRLAKDESVAMEVAGLALLAGDYEKLMQTIAAFTEQKTKLEKDHFNDLAVARAKDIRDAKKHARDLYTTAVTTAEGVEAAFAIMSERMRTEGQRTADSILAAFDALQNGLEDGFFAIMTGKFDDLGKIAENFFGQILKSGAKSLASSLMDGITKLLGKPRHGAVSQMPGDATGPAADYYAGQQTQSAGQYVQIAAAAYQGVQAYLGARKAGRNGLEAGGEGIMTLGAGVASFAPVVGLIIMALGGVAKILGVNSRKDLVTLLKASGSYSSKEVGSDNPELDLAYKEIPKTFMSSMSRLIEAGGRGSSANDLIGQLNKSIISYFYRTTYYAHAGSREDLEKDIQRILSTYAPRDLLKVAFGRNVAPNERPGVTTTGGASQYGIDEFDPNAPIPKLLAGLGFTAARIKQLALEIESADPKAFQEKLQGLVEAVSGLLDVAKLLSGNSVLSAIDADRKRTASGTLAVGASDITARATTLLSGLMLPEEEQISRAKEIIQLARQYYDEAKAAIIKLQDQWAQLSEQIINLGAAIRDVAFGKTQDWIDSDTRGNLRSVTDRLGLTGRISGQNNLSPAEMADLAEQAIVLINNLFQSLTRQLQQAEGTLAGFNELIDAFSEGYDHSATSMSTWSKKVTAFHAQVADAAKLSGVEQLNALEGVRQSAAELYQMQMQMLETIATNLDDLTSSIGDQIDSIYSSFSHTDIGRALERQMQPLQTKLYAGTITDEEKQQLSDLQGQYDQQLGREQAQRSLDRIRALQGQINTALSPEEVRRLTDEIQAEVNRYMGTFRADDPNRIAAAEAAIKILEETKKFAETAYKAMEAEIKAQTEAIKKALGESKTALVGAMDKIRDELLILAGILDEVNGLLGETFQREINTIIGQMNRLAPILTQLTTLFTDLTTAIGGSGSGSGGGKDGPPGKFDPTAEEGDPAKRQSFITSVDQMSDKTARLAAGPLTDMESKINRVNTALDGLASRLESGGGGSGSSALTAATLIRNNPNYLRTRTR